MSSQWRTLKGKWYIQSDLPEKSVSIVENNNEKQERWRVACLKTVVCLLGIKMGMPQEQEVLQYGITCFLVFTFPVH